MIKDERQALREKHTAHGRYGKGTTSCDICPGYYPCDVIRLLDATEPQCDHAIAIALHGTDPVGINFNYCPKCGDSL